MADTTILTSDTFTFGRDQIGCLVTQEVVDNIVDCMPPACMREDCTQMGEPYSFKYDESGLSRSTFATFKRAAAGAVESLWMFCGFCFLGENVERGTNIPCV